MAVLSEQEKVKVRHHLGYLNVDEVATFAIGVPAGVETQFAIEGSMNRVRASALPLIRHLIQVLDETEQQMVCGQGTVDVNAMGDISLNNTGEHRAQRELRRSYDYWVSSLANAI